MRIAVARRKLRGLRSEAEGMGWAEGVEVLSRAESAFYDPADKLMGRERDNGRLRCMVVRIAESAVGFYGQFLDLKRQHQQAREPAIQAYQQMLDMEQAIWAESDEEAPAVSDPGQLAAHLRKYASVSEYQDEKARILNQATIIETHATEIVNAQDRIDEADRGFVEAENMMREHLDKMLSGIETLLDTDIETLFSEDLSEEKICE